jgi:hypothetical protein
MFARQAQIAAAGCDVHGGFLKMDEQFFGGALGQVGAQHQLNEPIQGDGIPLINARDYLAAWRS